MVVFGGIAISILGLHFCFVLTLKRVSTLPERSVRHVPMG